MKKSLYCIVSLILWLWFVWAQSISFLPEWDWTFWNNCLVPIDVYMDTAGQEISAMDLIIETSMEYKDFVPTDLFPYFFPPIIKSSWLIHIVWFTVDPSERVKESGKIGTLYFNQKDGDIDWVVRLYFLEEGNTTDTNLNLAGWIDVLKEVWSAFVTFSDELKSCNAVNPVEKSAEGALEDVQNENVISWWFADKTQEEAFQETFEKIESNEKINPNDGENISHNIKNRVWIVLLFILLLIVLLLLIKNILSFEKESGKWKSKTKHKKK